MTPFKTGLLGKERKGSWLV